MAKKIYLSPSSQPANTYAAGNTNEQEECRKMARATAAALKRCGFDVVCADYGTMESRVRESNAVKADLHVCIHTNAFNEKVTGTRIMCNDLQGAGYKASKAVFDALAPITLGTSENVSARPNLYEIRMSKAPCVYVEVDFHDVKEIAKWLIEHTKEIGEAICKGICNYYGVGYKEAAKPKEEKQPMYRVFDENDTQIAAFREIQYALNQAEEQLKSGKSVRLTVVYK